MLPPSAQPRVLVVDDREDILELLGEYFRARGLEVETAYHSQEALRIAESGLVDVVLTDLNLEERSGMELIRRLRPLQERVAVLAMTGFPSVESAVEAMKLGVRDYLTKPFRLSAAYEAVLEASVELERERAVFRTGRRLQLLEEVLRLREPDQLALIYGLLANVAMADCQSEEVALWVVGPAGWEAVARGGEVRELQGMEPESVREAQAHGARAWSPVIVGDRVVAVLAVAGGSADGTSRLQCLSELAEVLGHAMERAGWKGPLGPGATGTGGG